MKKIYFVTGIDTGTGKSVATGLMARYLRSRGENAATLKMVQTGNVGKSEDVEVHRRLMGVGELTEDRRGWSAPQIFKFPASPHLAAALEGRRVDTGAILEGVRKMQERFDTVLVEGAGGLAVPLTEELLTGDFVREQGWPVILVASDKLGSLNHTLLSLEFLRNRQMSLAGVVYNRFCGESPLIGDDTRRMISIYLERYGFPPKLAETGKIDMEDASSAGADFGAIFGEEK